MTENDMGGCGVICEFNPFHNGHEYILNKARELTNCETLYCVMSGDFVQRAEPAIVDKRLRAAAAVNAGADAVIELPAAFSTAGAQYFASAGIRMLAGLGVTDLVCGAEGDAALLAAAAEVQAGEGPTFKAKLKETLREGRSYPAALAAATAAELSAFTEVETQLKKPNNILAVAYARAAFEQNVSVKVHVAARRGGNHNDETLPEQGFASATSLRKELIGGETRLDAYMPPLPKEVCFPDYRLFERLTAYILRTADLSKLKDAAEGIDVKLKKNALRFTELDDILTATKSKRYTMARLKRLCLQSMLSIDKDFDLEIMPMARLLAVRKDRKDILARLPDYIYVRASELRRADDARRKLLGADERAASLYAFLTGREGNSFYTDPLLVI